MQSFINGCIIEGPLTIRVPARVREDVGLRGRISLAWGILRGKRGLLDPTYLNLTANTFHDAVNVREDA